MAKKVIFGNQTFASAGENAPSDTNFVCPDGGTWITDGTEPLYRVDKATGVAHQTDEKHAMKCPGCPDGYIYFENSRDGYAGHHFIPS